MTERTQHFTLQKQNSDSDFTIFPLNNEHNVGSDNILVSTVTVDLVVIHFAHRFFGSAIAEEQLVPGMYQISFRRKYLSLVVVAHALRLIVATLATNKRIYIHYLSCSYVGASTRSSWLHGVPSSTEVRDLRGISAAQGVDADPAGHALLPVLPGGHGSQAETPSDLHEAELSTTPGRATPFQRAKERKSFQNGKLTFPCKSL